MDENKDLELEKYSQLNDDLRHVLFGLVFIYFDLNTNDIVELLGFSFEQVKPLLATLKRKKYIDEGQHYLENYYSVKALPYSVINALIDDADKFGWWFSVKDINNISNRNGEYSKGKDSENTLAMTEGLRLWVRSAGDQASERLRSLLMDNDENRNPNYFARMLAHFIVKRVSEEVPIEFHSPKDPLLLLSRYYINSMFMNSYPIKRTVDAVGRMIEVFKEESDDNGLYDKLFIVYVSALFWLNRKQDFLRLETSIQSKYMAFYEYFTYIFTEKFDVADKFFRRFLYNEEWMFDYQADNFIFRLLMAMNIAVAKPNKIAKNRPLDFLTHANNTCESPAFYYAAKYSEVAEIISVYLSRTWTEQFKDNGSLIKNHNPQDPCTIFDLLMLGWSNRTIQSHRQNAHDNVNALVPSILSIAKLGYINFAGLLISLFSDAIDADNHKAELDAIRAVAVRMLPDLEPVEEWRGALVSLAKFTERIGNRKTTVRRHRSAAWLLHFENGDDSGNSNGLIELKGFDFLVETDESLADEFKEHKAYNVEPIYYNGTNRFKKIMSDYDVILFNEFSKYVYYGISQSTFEMVIKTMAKMDNLFVFSSDEIYKSDYRNITLNEGCLQNIHVVEQQCSLNVTLGANGGMILKLPSYIKANEKAGRYIFHKVDDKTIAYSLIDNNFIKLYEIISLYSSNNELHIPKAGMSEMAGILRGLDKVVQVSHSEVSANEAEKLPRITANSECRVRLDFNAGELTIRGVILPLADNENLVFEPGIGAVEKLIVADTGNFIAVRDLEAERAAFAAVHEALKEFESWFDGKSTWIIDDIADAINAISILKNDASNFTLEWIENRRLRVTNLPTGKAQLESFRAAEDWFKLSGNFELDDGRVMSLIEILQAAKNRVGNYIKLSDGDYIALTKFMARELDALNAVGQPKNKSIEIPRAAVPMLDRVFGKGDATESLTLPNALAEHAREIREILARKPSLPAALHADLRVYQEEGFRWLSRLAACGLGSCLADDMGLGKTLQIIALLLERRKGGASLVVAPASVCGNWRSELRRFAPTLEPVMAMEALDEIESMSKLPENDNSTAGIVVIVSYGFILFHSEIFAAVKWNGVVLDEAQAIKNSDAKRTKIVKALSARFRVAATGTPVENRLGDLWSLFDFLNPGLLGSVNSFVSRFTRDGMASNELKHLVKPLVLRRLKQDVLDDLPEKTEITIPVELSKSERTAYEACRLNALASLSDKAEADGNANRISILAELTRLRRYCCHPSLVMPNEDLPSAKMEALLDLLDGLHQSGHRALIFSQFTDYLALVRQAIAARKWTQLYLDGGTPTALRERLVKDFQSGEAEFFLISLKAGGTGLNLTAANYVIITDPWWNPAVENQAADRTHRIGQKNPVTVYRLIASDTVEERVVELHREKRAIAEDMLEGTASAALTPAQLMKLFS